MSESYLNPEKKYPIKAYQLLTERFDCRYCLRTSSEDDEAKMTAPKTNTQKCAFCGTGSHTFWLGLIIGLAEQIKVPIALIERVNCKHATKEAILKEKQIVAAAKSSGQAPPEDLQYEAYQVLGDTVYHCINVSSSVSKGITNSQCYTEAVEKIRNLLMPIRLMRIQKLNCLKIRA